MLHLVFGNRLDALADEFVESARRHRGHALQSVEVAVPSLGVGRWLKYRVARACGVAAGIDTVYPAQVVWRLVEQALPQVQAASPVPGERLRWLIYQWLCDHGAGVAEVAAISREPLNRWQLAGRLARCFGDYLVFRPDWLQAWSKGVQPAPLRESAHARWQQALWQWLAQAAGLGAMRHPFEMYFALPVAPPNADAPPLHLFALPSLAPLYMDFFAQLAVRRAVHVYTLSPSREYWAQIVDARRAGGDEAAMGHPLLAAWGKAQRDFQFTLCEQLGEAQVADTQRFTPIDGAHVLGSIQRAMLDLQPAPHAALGDDDRSIAVHACHSLLRQTEVLHGALLDAFHRHPDWEPSDVLVLTPDLERLAPLVDAVFGNAPDAERLPYRITGLADRESAGLTEALLALLDPAGPMLGRFNVSAVMALLRRPAVAAAFDIGRDDLLRLAQWLGELGVHWGADASMRTEHGLPAQQRHTWAWGIARLLLGAVQPERALADSTGLLPHTALDGGELALVGRLTRVVAELQQWRETAAQPASMASWGERIGQLLQRCFHPIDDATQDWLIACRRVLAQMQSSAAGLDAGDAVPAAMVRRMLADGLRASAPGAVPSGQISFARLGELRGLPYKGVYLLGIEGADFPRDDAAAEFDLLHSAPRRGDRSRRADDRGAFLDAMLAARDCFEVFCCGSDAATNDPLALATPVQELLAHLQQITGHMPERWLRHHPLQPFSPQAFEAPSGSFSSQYYPIAQSVLAVQSDDTAHSNAAPWLKLPPGAPLGDDGRAHDHDDSPITGEQLARMLAEPTDWFVRTRLGVRLPGDRPELSDALPGPPDALTRWQLAERLRAAGADALDPQRTLRVAMAGPELPSGVAGQAMLGGEVGDLWAFEQACRAIGLQGAAATQWLLPFAPWPVQATSRVHGTQACSARFGKLKLRDLAHAAVVQVARALADEPATPGPLVHVARDYVLQLDAVAPPLARQCVDAWQGLMVPVLQGTALMPTRTAWAYIRALQAAADATPEGLATAQQKGNRKWADGERGESAHLLWRCLLGQVGDLPPQGWDQFAQQAFAALLPLVQITPLAEWVSAATAVPDVAGSAA